MNHIKKVAIVVAALIVLVAAIIIAMYGYKHQSKSRVSNGANVNARVQKPKEGTLLVEGMPTELLMDKKAALKSSEKTIEKDAIAYSAVFVSKEKMSDLYNLYLKYVTSEGYAVLNKSLQKDFAGIYAMKIDSGDVSVVIQPLDKDHVSISLTYLDKSKK